MNNAFFQRYFWTLWGAQTSAMSPFSAMSNFGPSQCWNQSSFYTPWEASSKRAASEQAGSKQASNRQATNQPTAITSELGKNHSSIMVLHIRPKFWWMLPLGVRDNHTKCEPQSQRWRPGTGIAEAGPPFQNLKFRAKIIHFWPKTPTLLKIAKRRKIVATLHMHLDFRAAKNPLGPSNSTICPRTAPKKAPKSPRTCAHWPLTALKQKHTISWATWLKTRLPTHPIQSHRPNFGGFHPSKLPQPTLRPQYLGPKGCGKRQKVTQIGGCQNGSTRSTGCKKKI